jgi:hypothetical protein
MAVVLLLLSAFIAVFRSAHGVYLTPEAHKRRREQHQMSIEGEALKQNTKEDLPHQATKPGQLRSNVKTQDIKNQQQGPMILNPQLFNIYYGSGWTTKQMNVVDNLATNLGASDYYKIVQSFKDPSGKTAAPTVFVGSAQDASVTPGPVTLAGIDSLWANALQGYVTSGKINGVPFDLSTFDLSNTLFSFILGPGFVFDTAPSYCGYHTATQVTLPSGTLATVYVCFDLYGGSTSTPNSNYGCNNAGASVGFDSTATIDTVSPNNDGYLDGLAGPYTHEIFEVRACVPWPGCRASLLRLTAFPPPHRASPIPG